MNVLTPLASGTTLVVQLRRDGVDVPGFLLAYGGVNPPGGVQVLPNTPLTSFPAGHTFDLKVSTTTTGEATPIALTATIGALQGTP